MGITINAINLPSIWMVFVSVAPDAILRSIRSVISLASLGSRGSKNSKGSKGSRGGSNAEHLKSGTSSSSIAPIAGGGVSAAVESHELGSHRRKEMSNVPVGQIQVSRSVEQTASCRRHEEV
ncbi:hypothetical protein QQS21_009998 [Conoideocrella luteorostrata]|uniref:Uncharacterized protein n=1 Tax=Conoideocrella luteorostrata TaxID=1105319 RepID=A0AAJ0CI92_9HYPO|nr:hypothetical protein QQS21_009998 [Conoideocrella luteorostrata]